MRETIMIEEFLNNSITRFIRLDPNYRTLLEPLANKTVFLDLSSPSIALYLHFFESHITLSREKTTPPEATIRCRPVDLMLLHHSPDSPKIGDVTLSGNLKTAEAMQHFFRSLALDWEEELSHFIGDPLAFKIGDIVRSKKKKMKKSLPHLKEDLQQYLHFDRKILPDKDTLNNFYEDVDVLLTKADRLSTRLTRLENHTPRGSNKTNEAN
jgi:ubiquinone biosynthesis protein UbiJ